jgi:hypothetical protein
VQIGKKRSFFLSKNIPYKVMRILNIVKEIIFGAGRLLVVLVVFLLTIIACCISR